MIQSRTGTPDTPPHRINIPCWRTHFPPASPQPIREAKPPEQPGCFPLRTLFTFDLPLFTLCPFPDQRQISVPSAAKKIRPLHPRLQQSPHFQESGIFSFFCVSLRPPLRPRHPAPPKPPHRQRPAGSGSSHRSQTSETPSARRGNRHSMHMPCIHSLANGGEHSSLAKLAIGSK